MWCLIPTLLIFHLLRGCDSLTAGPPASICLSLIPQSPRSPPQNGSSPYVIKAVKVDEKVKVNISSETGEEFRGFALQARHSRNRDRIVNGTFSTTENVTETEDCDGGSQNTLTASSDVQKNVVESYWTPDANASEAVIFRATVFKTADTFWTEIDSNLIEASETNDGREATPKNKIDKESKDFYTCCFKSKGCLGSLADCVSRKDCPILLTYAEKPDGIEFGLYGYKLKPNEYMAMAISTDNIMGNDSVTYCYEKNGTFVVLNSSNVENIHSVPELENRTQTKPENGIVSCHWKEPYVTRLQNMEFDIKHQNYFIFLDTGNVTEDNLGKITNFRYLSPGKVNFTSYKNIENNGIDPSAPGLSTKPVKNEGTTPGGNKKATPGGNDTTPAGYKETTPGKNGAQANLTGNIVLMIAMLLLKLKII